MRYCLIQMLARRYQLGRLCGALGVSRSGYHGWLGRQESERVREDRRLRTEIRAVFRESRGRYGSPRVHAELQQRGQRCSRKRVARLMREEGLAARKRRRFRVTTQSDHGFGIAPNLLDRQFCVTGLDTVWLGDITYIWTNEGWLYLAAVMDLCSRRIVGWATSERLTQDLAIRALSQALDQRRPQEGLLHHTDRGSQYAAHAYQGILAQHGIKVSMSRRGNCYDNAPMESFFSTFKTELVYRCDCSTRRQVQRETFEYIEIFYNRKRRHSALGYMSPSEFEKQEQAA